MVKAARARALIHGRHYVVPEDLFALADDVLLHRIRLSYEALADGITKEQVLREVLRPATSVSRNGSFEANGRLHA